MAALGKSAADIAEALGVSPPTVRKAFALELAGGAAPAGLFDLPLQAAPVRPIAPRAGGRKPVTITAAQRNEVARLAAMGWPVDQIALALGFTEAALKRLCRHELSAGALSQRAKLDLARWQAAISGNVAAQTALAKQLADLDAKAARDAADEQFRARAQGADQAEPEAATSPAKGKKELRAEVAADVAQTGRFARLANGDFAVITGGLV